MQLQTDRTEVSFIFTVEAKKGKGENESACAFISASNAEARVSYT